MVGSTNESEVEIEGVKTTGLIDTGSMITTVAVDFFKTMEPKLNLLPLEDFNLEVASANGEKLPFLGYAEVNLKVPSLSEKQFTIPALIVPRTEYNINVPVIVGTNIIRQLHAETMDDETDREIPEVWDMAFKTSCSSVGTVKSTQRVNLQPMETIVINGFVRKSKHCESAVTEPSSKGYSSRFTVCPRVVKLDNPGNSARVPVKIFNMSAKVVEIPEKANLCELYEVKVLRNHPFIEDNTAATAQIHQHTQPEKEKEINQTQIHDLDLSESKLNEEQKEEVTSFLMKWRHIFSKSLTDLGSCNLTKHKINLQNDEPFKEPYRRIPPALFEEVRQHLKEMLDAGAIRESQSPYSSNVVIVRKKDGTIRFCIDYRKLNSRTKKDAYAIPRVEDTLHLLSGAKYFSKLDLRSGYWQIEIDEQDKQKTAFQVSTIGFFEFNRMAFGLCNAPATFQRVMERCMGEMNLRDCLIYLDDVIIFSSTFEEHLKRLGAVFTRLEKHNLKLKATKCEFFKSKVTYLGHVVSENGIETDPDKIVAVQNWSIPKNVKETRAFLGFTGYYRRFIRGYASIVRPLNDLLQGQPTKKNRTKRSTQVFFWGPEQQHAFNTIVQKLTNPPILAYADYSKPFKLHTDASGLGLGAVLYQEQNGIDRVIGYASRSLKPSEKNYPAHKLEFLALKWAVVDKFHDYLYGSSFEVLTDNNPLCYVFSSAKLDAVGHRWIAELANYNCIMKYRSGKLNNDADGLSRLQNHEDDQQQVVFPEVLKAISFSVSNDNPPAETLLLPSQDNPIELEDNIQNDFLDAASLKTYDWIKAQSQDPSIKALIDVLRMPKKPSRKEAKALGINMFLFRDIDKLTFRDGVLYRLGQMNKEPCQQLILPWQLRSIVFHAYHSDLGHQGRDRTSYLLKRRFYWPGMDKYIRLKVQHCGRCIRRKIPPTVAAELVPISTSAPMELVCIDYLTVERSKGGFENILVISDHFSRYSQAIPTRNQTASTTAKALYEKFFLHYGFPAKLHSDRGQNFESKVIQRLCDMVGMAKSRTTPYHAMCNGKVERFNQTILNMMGTLEEYQKADWKAHVSTLTHAYNATINDSTGYSPFYLMFGRHPRLAVDAFLGLPSPNDGERHNSFEYVEKLRSRLTSAYEIAKKEATRKGQRYKAIYDRRVRFAAIEEGDRVLVRNVGLKGRQKLADTWESSVYVVLRQPIPDIPVFEVQRENKPTSKIRKLHRNMLLPFFALPSPLSEDPIMEEPETPAKEKTYHKNTYLDEVSVDNNSYDFAEIGSDSEEEIKVHRPQRKIKPPNRLTCDSFREGLR